MRDQSLSNAAQKDLAEVRYSPDPLSLKRILRRKELEELVGLSRSTIYEMMSLGTFPRPIRLGKRAVGWKRESIEEWLQGRSTVRSE